MLLDSLSDLVASKMVAVVCHRRRGAKRGVLVISRSNPRLFWRIPLLGFSLLAIAFVGDQPYLGLAIALAGGVVLGFVCMRRFESKPQEGTNGALARIVGRR